jgi:hypothetical protein
MHPGIPTQLPLLLTIVEHQSGRIAARFEMGQTAVAFRPVLKAANPSFAGRPCRGGRKSDLTCDLRLD